MSPVRLTVLGTSVLLVTLAQGAVVARLPWPGSGVPHLAALVVVATALVAGARAGALTGFASGLMLDLLPPASHALGQWAFVLCLLGLVVGMLAADVGDSLLLAVPVAAVTAALAPLAFTLLGQLLGDPRADVLGAVQRLPGVALGTLLLALVLTLPLALVRGRRRDRPLPIEPVAPRLSAAGR